MSSISLDQKAINSATLICIACFRSLPVEGTMYLHLNPWKKHQFCKKEKKERKAPLFLLTAQQKAKGTKEDINPAHLNYSLCPNTEIKLTLWREKGLFSQYVIHQSRSFQVILFGKTKLGGASGSFIQLKQANRISTKVRFLFLVARVGGWVKWSTRRGCFHCLEV